MRRYFYDSSSVISKWLQKNAFAKSYEDAVYFSAFLSALKNNPSQALPQIRQQILNMSINEQLKYSNNSHIQHLFHHFHLLYKYSRGRDMIVDSNTNQQTTALVDPDKFPIWDLKKYNPIYRSLWGSFIPQIRYDIGFQPIVRQSQIEHIAGGRGVYAILSSKNEKIAAGQFLGLIPGRVYDNFNDFKGITMKDKKDYHKKPQHLHFPSGKILQLTDLSIQRKSPFGLNVENTNRVDATYHNPYAFGHMINHPPPGYEPNVIFTQINITNSYFPNHLLQYLPYQSFAYDKKNITLFGIYAVRQIEHKEELFVNYSENHIYPIDDIPEWLIQPPKFSPIFEFSKKGQYQITESSYWQYIEKKALHKNKELFDKYEKQKVFRADETCFESSTQRFKKLKIRLSDQNEYQHM